MKNAKSPILTEFSFLRLLLASFVVNKDNHIINKNELEYKLYYFCDDPEFHFLFSNICKIYFTDEVGQVDLSSAFQAAYAFGLLNILSDVSRNINFLINLSDEEAKKIISEYPPKIRRAILKLAKILTQGTTTRKPAYTSSNDSEVIAKLLKEFYYDSSKAKEVLSKYSTLIKGDGPIRTLNLNDK